MLVDEASIHVRAGDGGDGVVSFRREAYVPKGGPDGGDGGNGGDVVLVADAGVDTLLDMAGRHHWRATAGRPGKGKNQTGGRGSDCVIRVPPGTLIYDEQTGELMADLDEPEKRLIAAAGGKGGRGNTHFKSATNQTPRQSTSGEPGERRQLRMELKLIADVGLIGKPNAGKSTLLSRISAARPKVAGYPFTTLEPQLGIAELSIDRRLVIADIPGLIEGAAEGAGLGHAFLRHIERTRVLVHLIELEPTDGSDPIENYRAIRKELEAHSAVLAEKPELIAISKVDLLGDESDHQAGAELIERELGTKTYAISGVSGAGCMDLLRACWHQVQQARADQAIK